MAEVREPLSTTLGLPICARTPLDSVYCNYINPCTFLAFVYCINERTPFDPLSCLTPFMLRDRHSPASIRLVFAASYPLYPPLPARVRLAPRSSSRFSSRHPGSSSYLW